MGKQYYDDVDNDGKTKTTTTYSGEQGDFEYEGIKAAAKKDFNFLLDTDEMGLALDKFLEDLSTACTMDGAFDINGTKKTIEVPLYSEIETDVNNLKKSLIVLHDAFTTDIANIDAELDVNFGHWVGTRVKKEKTKTETVSN